MNFIEKTLPHLHTEPIEDVLKELLASEDDEPYFIIYYEGDEPRSIQFSTSSKGNLILGLPRQELDGEEWDRAVKFFESPTGIAHAEESPFSFSINPGTDTFRTAALVIRMFKNVFQVKEPHIFVVRSHRFFRTPRRGL